MDGWYVGQRRFPIYLELADESGPLVSGPHHDFAFRDELGDCATYGSGLVRVARVAQLPNPDRIRLAVLVTATETFSSSAIATLNSGDDSLDSSRREQGPRKYYLHCLVYVKLE